MSWIQTHTGKTVTPLSPDQDTICIEDIAHALSNICRWTGHTKYFYSVAQHCIIVASLVPEQYNLAALMHDASEAYLDDISHPIKPHIQGYQQYEKVLTDAINAKFGISVDNKCKSIIKEVDRRLCVTEAVHLMQGGPVNNWISKTEYIPFDNIVFAREQNADVEKLFLERFHEYSRKSILVKKNG